MEKMRIEKVLISDDIKSIYWGNGPWIGEFDYISDIYKDYIYRVIRKAVWSDTKKKYLECGYFCGYVKIPSDYPFYKNISEFLVNKNGEVEVTSLESPEFELDVHGGITFSEINESGEFWIGFDCAHSMDIIPSIKHTDHLKEMIEKFPAHAQQLKNSPIFKKSYKNSKFAEEQCKSLIDQLISLKSS